MHSRKKQRQRTLLEFASSSSAVKIPSPKKRRTLAINSEDDSDSDPGRIKFEPDVIEVQVSDEGQSIADTEAIYASPRRSARIRHARKATSVASTSSPEAEVTSTRRSGGDKRSQFEANSDESAFDKPKKKRRLVRGKRPETLALQNDDDGDEDLIEEVDEDRILDSRLRDRSKKSAFAQNLERLQRRRRGQLSASGSEIGTDRDDNSAPSSPDRAERPTLFQGARPTTVVLDEDEPEDETSMNESEDNFIVDDDGEEIPELPTMFSMGTFQDLSHHFKVICQLFVHLAVKPLRKRRQFIAEEMKKEYFSVPLAIVRRKLSGMQDSLVVSSIWKPEFKIPLQTLPEFRLEQLDFSVPLCDACHLGNRIATLRGSVGGQKYDAIFEPLENSNDEEHPSEIDWNLGRFCAARAQVFHLFNHWEYNLYHSLRAEVDRLREAFSPKLGKHRPLTQGRRVFIPATNGPPSPGDLNNGDAIMDWLDGRGIINAQWAKVNEMMKRAHKLEARSKEAEDDIEIG